MHTPQNKTALCMLSPIASEIHTADSHCSTQFAVHTRDPTYSHPRPRLDPDPTPTIDPTRPTPPKFPKIQYENPLFSVTRPFHPPGGARIH